MQEKIEVGKMKKAQRLQTVLGTFIATIFFCWSFPAPAAEVTAEAQADNLFHEADSAETEKNYPRAIEKYTTLIKSLKVQDPNNIKMARAKARLARLYVQQAKYDQAEPLFSSIMRIDRKMLQKDPEYMIDLDDLSDAYLNLENDKRYGFESQKHSLLLRQYIDPHHPHLAESYKHLAESCARAGNYKDAIHAAETMVAIQRTYSLQKKAALAFGLVILAQYRYNAKDYAGAKQAAKEGLATIQQCACAQNAAVTFNEILRRSPAKP
jgi:tetratricopeptide (TPR) repeat protein